MSRRTRILVADDHADVREMMRISLVLEGYDVITVRDGAEALRILEVEPVDAAVLDVMMPGLDGLSVLARLRTEQATSDLPVVVVTAASVCFDAQRTPYRTAHTVFLAKPVDPAEVSRVIDAMFAEEETGTPPKRGRLTA